VPLRIVLRGSPLQRWRQNAQGTVIDELERHPEVDYYHMALLGEPGSSESTALHHLAWSHAAAYLGNFSDALLLSSSEAPLVPVSLELHSLPASRCPHPDDTSLSFVIVVLIQKDGIEVDYRSQRSATSSLPCTFCEKGALPHFSQVRCAGPLLA